MALFVKSPCGPCCTPTIGTITCVSRQGNGTLRGWTNYLGDTTDWNRIKYTRRNQTGDVWTCVGDEFGWAFSRSASLYGYSQCSPTTGVFDYTNAFGTLCVADTSSYTSPCGVLAGSPDAECEEVAGYSDSGSDGTRACESVVEPIITLWPDYHSAEASLAGWRKSPRSLAVPDAVTRVLTGVGAISDGLYFECDIDAPYFWVYAGGSATLALVNPDTVFEALGRGSPTVGTDHWSDAGAIESTTAGSTEQTTLTGPKSSRATIPCSNLVSGTDYEVTVYIDRYLTGTSTFVDRISETIAFTASGTTEEIEYTLPNDGTHRQVLDIPATTIAAA